MTNVTGVWSNLHVDFNESFGVTVNISAQKKEMVKEKPNQIRTYDEDGFRLRAACICVRDETEQEVSAMQPVEWETTAF